MTQHFVPTWGVDIMSASTEAIRLAKKNGEDHYFKFNGVKVTVSADSKVLHIVGLYYLASEGDEVGPFHKKEEEPKLYDYYFYAAGNDFTKTHSLEKYPVGVSVQDVMKNITNRLDEVLEDYQITASTL